MHLGRMQLQHSVLGMWSRLAARRLAYQGMGAWTITVLGIAYVSHTARRDYWQTNKPPTA